MKKYLVIILLLIAKSGMAQITVVDSFLHGGIMRSYRIYVPAIYNAANPVPLVLNLHGYTSDNAQQEIYGDFRPIADTANFIVVHPNGTFDGTGYRFWNAFGASPVDDVGFLLALIDTVESHYTINPNRVYSTGMSNGGFMSHVLACTAGERFAAIASVTGSMTVAMKTACTPAHPTPVMQVHGTADAVVPYYGGGVYLPVDSVVSYWYKINNCNPTPVYTAVPNIVIADGCTAEHFVFNGGTSGTSVEFFKVTGGGHSWPGAPINVNVTNMDFSASKEIWRFFSQYSLDNLVPAGIGTISSGGLNIYPNPTVNNFTLQFPFAGKKEIMIISLNGEQIFSVVTSETSYTLSAPAPGIYVVQVVANSNTYVEKLVVQ